MGFNSGFKGLNSNGSWERRPTAYWKNVEISESSLYVLDSKHLYNMDTILTQKILQLGRILL